MRQLVQGVRSSGCRYSSIGSCTFCSTVSAEYSAPYWKVTP